ncbi:hypothetical protein J6590_062581 [Homalodisca vitripennis]|nr:hypothetical protein J6590_062581 [Homalodisca vitripennis]
MLARDSVSGDRRRKEKERVMIKEGTDLWKRKKLQEAFDKREEQRKRSNPAHLTYRHGRDQTLNFSGNVMDDMKPCTSQISSWKRTNPVLLRYRLRRDETLYFSGIVMEETKPCTSQVSSWKRPNPVRLSYRHCRDKTPNFSGFVTEEISPALLTYRHGRDQSIQFRASEKIKMDQTPTSNSDNGKKGAFNDRD